MNKIDKKINELKNKFKEKKVNKKLFKIREKYHKQVLLKEKRRTKLEENPNTEAFISLNNINKIYDNHVQAVYDFNLDIKEQEFIVFVGPSGCGKSTTLRMIAGLEDITSGDLYIDGFRANDLEPKDRNISMVFQSYALYPHMSVYENMAFGLKINHYKKDEIKERVLNAAKILELEDYLDRKPSELSGGQCQRVALGRSIVRNSKLFLLDEPLSNLDAKLRTQMRSEIVKLHNKLRATSIYVTHDQTEALTMASRIVVMNKGYIKQIGTPDEIYHKPANLFVASFIGSPQMNILKAKIDNNCISFNNGFVIKTNENTFSLVKEFYKNRLHYIDKFINNEINEYLLSKEDVFSLINKINCIDDIKIINKKYKLNGNNKKECIFNLINKEFNNIEVNKINLDLLTSLKEQIGKLYISSQRQIDERINTLLIEKSKIEEIYDKDIIDVIVGIRSENIEIDSNFEYKFKIELKELLGNEYILHLNFIDNKELLCKVSFNLDNDLSSEVGINISLNKIHLFDPISEAVINIK